jgi:hypothetical protein
MPGGFVTQMAHLLQHGQDHGPFADHRFFISFWVQSLFLSAIIISECNYYYFWVQVKGAAGDVADKASDVSKGALGDTPKPKGGLFGRINEEALTNNSPSKQIGK